MIAAVGHPVEPNTATTIIAVVMSLITPEISNIYMKRNFQGGEMLVKGKIKKRYNLQHPFTAGGICGILTVAITNYCNSRICKLPLAGVPILGLGPRFHQDQEYRRKPGERGVLRRHR